MAKEIGLDMAPIEFQTFYFSHVLVVPPNASTSKNWQPQNSHSRLNPLLHVCVMFVMILP